MTNEIIIDPNSFDAAAAGVDDAAVELQSAYEAFKRVVANLGDFLGNDDAGRQIKAQYDPSYEACRTAMEKLIGVDFPALSMSLRHDATSWRSADDGFGD